jgi:transcriptional regulator with XRE-family HTH domain
VEGNAQLPDQKNLTLYSMTRKRTPHSRLKALRKVIGITQAKLAERCGISYPYLLAVETGQRSMSENLAKRISFATGVSKEWLLHAAGTSETPQNYFGKYTKKTWEAHCRWEGNKFPHEDFGDVGDELMNSDDVMLRAGAALRASWRKGKFTVALMMLRDFIKSMEEDLQLGNVVKTEFRLDVPNELVDAEHTGEDLPSQNSLHWLLPLLSHYGRYRWSLAFTEGGEKKERFVSEMEDLLAMIIHSFTLGKAK